MNLVKKTSLILLSGLVVMFSQAGVAAAAQTTDQLELIKQACPMAQASLQQVQRSELVARTIRGSSYDSILTLMASLNTRLVANRQNANEFIAIANDLNVNYRQNFYNRYTAYATALNKTIRSNCNDPQLFYNLLEDTRAKRAQIAEEVQAIDILIDDYQKSVKALQTSLATQAEEDEEE